MSLIRRETIKCPHCHQESEFEFWNSVNIDLNPELKEKIFNGELFIFHCPFCGLKEIIPTGTIYHDMKNKFMLFFSFCENDNSDYKSVNIEMPKEMMNDNYTFRIVYGLNQLKEKIIILEQGLNDIAIERQKYMLSHIVKPEIAQKGYELYCLKTEAPDEEFEYGTIFYFYDDNENNQITTIRCTMDTYYEHCLACKFDSRMKINGFECIDQNWIANKLKNSNV